MALPVAVVAPLIDAIQANLPLNVSLDGTGSVPGTGGNQISSYVWTILDKPLGSAAVFADTGTSQSTLAQPVVNSVDSWGNIRIFLQVTDDQANLSQGDPLQAPDSAFGVIRVNSTNAGTYGPTTGLQKLAKGERNYHPYARRVDDELDALRWDHENRTVNGIADVNDPSSTGPHLDNMMDGSYATDTGAQGGVKLHFHEGSAVDPATTQINGVVTLDDSPINPANPVVLNNENMIYSATMNGTFLANGFNPAVVTVQTSPTGNENEGHCGLAVIQEGAVEHIGVTFRDGGDSTAGGQKEAAVYKMTSPQWLAADFVNATLLHQWVFPAPVSPHAPIFFDIDIQPVTVMLRDVLVFLMVDDYSGGISAAGSGATVTIKVRRSV